MKTQEQILKLIPNYDGRLYPHSTNISVIVTEAVDEYPVLETPQVTVREVLNWFKVDQILEWEHGKLDDRVLEVLKTRIYRKALEDETKSGSHMIGVTDEEDNNYSMYRITFWCPGDKDWVEYITRYLEEYTQYLLGTVWSKGGDDSFYDYNPSATDVFFQLCKFFDAKEIWDKFYKDLIEDIDEEDIDQSIYRTWKLSEIPNLYQEIKDNDLLDDRREYDIEDLKMAYDLCYSEARTLYELINKE